MEASLRGGRGEGLRSDQFVAVESLKRTGPPKDPPLCRVFPEWKMPIYLAPESALVHELTRQAGNPSAGRAHRFRNQCWSRIDSSISCAEIGFPNRKPCISLQRFC